MESILKLKRIVIFAFFLVAFANSYSLFGQCPQNNFTVAGFQLRDQNGDPFSVTDNYQLGQQVNGELWVMLGGSSTNGYNMRFFFDVYINGTRTQDDQYECLFPGQQAQQNVWWPVRDFTWTWGDVVDIKDIFIHWDTGTAQPGTSCVVSNKNNINSQCYGNLNGYTAAVPLFPKFDFDSNGICNTTIEFISETIGGTPPFNYTFEWDFDGLGTASGPNPVFNFPSSGTYTIGLTANDGTSITTVYKDIFIDPNFGIQVDIFPTKINDSSGIIYVESVTGGTSPYTYSWTGPNGFSSTDKDIFNLANGLYTLTVTDVNGCTQTVSYNLDIASVLGFSWKSITLKGDNSKIEICWEVPSSDENCIFEIERSSGDISNFTSIGTVPWVKSGGEFQAYSFTDNSFSAFEHTFYYRIVRKSDMGLSYSPVKMFKKEGLNSDAKLWVAYPNPSIGEDIFIKYVGKADPHQKEITITAFSSGALLQSLTLKSQLSDPINLTDLFADFPRGHLILRVQMDDEMEVIQLIH